MFQTFGPNDFHQLCNLLAEKDDDLRLILERYGYPPLWSRPNTFESLVHIILEQQVSLASALAALNKLKAEIGEITPARFLELSSEALRACYFSRQKTVYVRDLAEKLQNGDIDLYQLEILPDNEIRAQLKQVKGIGDWTVDIYLIFILHHTDIFPTGDLAAVNALKNLKKLPKGTTKEVLLDVVSHWKPYRTIGLMMLWHYYLEERKPVNRRTLI
ncbi:MULTISPECIES: DNA-3-methyladenine glycosylase [Pedobacter]|uniref:DNA-3-methyladenine glycosylase family protein n=1 Tax=Pedobacter TaxID=84567 RepID=UPI001E635C6F|nr:MULTISPECIES: DNA-3-methyladenine glycosylase 2 family protein [Pedobacter]